MSTDNKQSLPAITLAAIGVVYGDIGTSPLYTLRECLSGQFGFGVERDAVFGFLSLIFWLLILTVSLKYITFVMRADNAGEGGILTLMSQPVLASLSRAIPSQVWLTELRYQPPALILTGYAITLPALSTLRDALGQIAGFTPGTPGELRQDSRGHWLFTLHLKSEG